MMPIVWSLSVLWFGHPRPSAPPPSVSVAPRTTVMVAVERNRALSDALADAIVAEAAAIWRPLGVETQSRQADAVRSPVMVSVVVEDSEPPAGSESLGWIHFLGTGRPEPIIYLSRAAATRLLDDDRASRELPLQRHDALLARILGRALAHELGHYLLASTHHTAHGLMRASWPLGALVAQERIGFELTLAEISELQEQSTAAPSPVLRTRNGSPEDLVVDQPHEEQ
jgi:hypothetical protein